MVFRLGHLGLGYYIDKYMYTPMEAEVVQDRSVAVVELELDKLVPADDPPVQMQQRCWQLLDRIAPGLLGIL